MLHLNQNWMTEGTIDFEYKKYILLAYLRDIEQYFKEEKLYPPLSELIQHQRTLQELKTALEQAQNQLPKSIKRIDWQQVGIQYEQMPKPQFYETLEAIIAYALPRLENKVKTGTGLFDNVDQHLQLFPLGINPINQEAGFFFIGEKWRRLIHLYQFEFTLFETASSAYRGLKTSFLQSYTWSISTNYDSIKYEWIKKDNSRFIPATYVIETETPFPLQETLLPVAKRKLIRHISKL